MLSYFGINWKEKTAEACSWIELIDTDEYVNYINDFPPLQALQVDGIVRNYNHINDANSNCN